MLSGARGEIAFFSSVPSLVGLMANGARMYESVADAAKVAGNLRSILGFEAGAYHPVTLAGSGIESWDDIKGKTVFTGPPPVRHLRRPRPSSGSSPATSLEQTMKRCD